MAEPLPRRMRSKAFSLGLVGALAISLTACGSTARAQPNVPRYCVDEFDQVIPDAQCLATPVASPGSRTGSTSSGRRWYYGGTRSGSGVSGGSYNPPPASAGGSQGSGIRVGGFGGSSSSSGSSSGGGKSGSGGSGS